VRLGKARVLGWVPPKGETGAQIIPLHSVASGGSRHREGLSRLSPHPHLHRSRARHPARERIERLAGRRPLQALPTIDIYGTMASASISIRAAASISLATSRMLVAGRISAKTSP